MTISSTSRYATSQVVTINGPAGLPRQVIVPSEQTPYSFNFVFHIVTGTEDDRADLLAANYYGNAQLWWMIADANPEILNWTDLATGTVIRIPSAT